MMWSSRPSLLNLYGPIRSTDNLSHGMASDFLAVNFPYLKSVFYYLTSITNLNVFTYVFSQALITIHTLDIVYTSCTSLMCTFGVLVA